MSVGLFVCFLSQYYMTRKREKEENKTPNLVETIDLTTTSVLPVWPALSWTQKWGIKIVQKLLAYDLERYDELLQMVGPRTTEQHTRYRPIMEHCLKFALILDHLASHVYCALDGKHIACYCIGLDTLRMRFSNVMHKLKYVMRKLLIRLHT